MATIFTTRTCNGVTLNVIETDASNINLVSLVNATGGAKKLSATSYYGVNGSFFELASNRLFNIVEVNGTYIGPYDSANNFSNGAGNSIGTGAIAWNGSQLSFNANAVYNTDVGMHGISGNWIQGGIALWLGYSAWETQVRAQRGAANYLTDGTRPRTAMIANMHTNRIYLIVSSGDVAFGTFRSAIQTYLGISDGAQANNTYQGLMLDGGGSTQMRYWDKTNLVAKNVNTDARAVPQIVALRTIS